MRASKSDVRVRWGAVGCHDGATDDWKIKKPQKKAGFRIERRGAHEQYHPPYGFDFFIQKALWRNGDVW